MNLLRHAGRDLRIGVRALLRRPGFSIVAVATLALGIAVNTAVFSIVNTVLLRPLPFHDAERLVQLETVRGGERGKLSLREVRDLEERTQVFSEIAAYVPGSQYSLAGEGTPEKPHAILMTHNLFRVLGVALGRRRAAVGRTHPRCASGPGSSADPPLPGAPSTRPENRTVADRNWPGGDPAAADSSLPAGVAPRRERSSRSFASR
jgi:MacB-like periplasmic core domain